ncbi:MAG: DNA translocase FtsK 4TM domain-containing protein, partial [Gemmatimonadaceae bacterium]
MGSSHLQKRELAGVALSLFAVFLAAAVLLGEGRAQASSCLSAGGLTGPVGACLRRALLTAVGVPAMLLIPLLPAVHALRMLDRVERRTDRSWLVFLAGVIALLPVGLGLALGVGRESTSAAGVWGAFVSYYLVGALGAVGAWIVVILAFSALTVLALAWNPIRVLVGWRTMTLAEVAAPVAGEPALPKRRRRSSELEVMPPPPRSLLEPAPEEMPGVDYAPPPDSNGWATLPDEAARRAGPRKERKSKVEQAEDRLDRIATEIHSAERADVTGEELPPPELLNLPEPRNADQDRRELDAMGARIKEALGTFRVEAEIVGRTTGPVVTQFEVEPAPGVKVRQIATLSSDLALAMRAPSIRIVAPIPGRGAV